MAELNFIVDQAALDIIRNTPITANFDEMKTALIELTAPYKGMIVSEDAISSAKADRAKIRKAESGIDEYRKRIKRVYNEQFSEFEDKCKELTGICKEASDNLDTQIKQFEEEKKQVKLAELEAYYQSLDKKYPDYMDYNRVFNPKWGNATYKMETAKEEIESYVNSVDVNVAYVRSLNDEFEAVMLDALKQGKSVSEAMGISLRLKEQKEYQERKKKEAEERARREAEIEARAREALERAAEAERQKYAPIPDVEGDEMIRRTILEPEAPVAQSGYVDTEIHTVKLWVSGTKEQLAELSDLMHLAGVTYGSL